METLPPPSMRTSLLPPPIISASTLPNRSDINCSRLPHRVEIGMKRLALSSPAPRFKAGVPACAEAALNEPPCAGGAWAAEESAARMRRGYERRRLVIDDVRTGPAPAAA